MKDIRDAINMILDNFLVYFLLAGFFTPFCLILLSISSTIIENLFDIKLERNSMSPFFIIYLGGIVYLALLLESRNNEEESDKDFYKKITLLMFVFSLSVIYFFSEPVKEKASSKIPSKSYHAHREYSPNYSYHDTHSSSNYRHSEPADYIMPPSMETKPLIPQNDNEKHNNQSFYELSDINLEEISPQSSENAFYERWENPSSRLSLLSFRQRLEYSR